jgi:hypothetical protein
VYIIAAVTTLQISPVIYLRRFLKRGHNIIMKSHMASDMDRAHKQRKTITLDSAFIHRHYLPILQTDLPSDPMDWPLEIWLPCRRRPSSGGTAWSDYLFTKFKNMGNAIMRSSLFISKDPVQKIAAMRERATTGGAWVPL